MKKEKKIRLAVGINGMILYTPDQSKVCTLMEDNEESFTIREEPRFLREGSEEFFYTSFFNPFSDKQKVFLFIRLVIEISLIILSTFVITGNSFLSVRNMVVIYALIFALFFYLEFSLFQRLQKAKSKSAKTILRYRGALHKALNAFKKLQRPPSLEEIKKANKYGNYEEHHLTPYDVFFIVPLFVAIIFSIPNIFIQIISIPIFIIIAIRTYQSSFFGLLRINYVAEPEEYEMKMARELVEFWFYISFSNTPKA